MIEPEHSAEQKPVDWMGAFKIAGVVIVGLLAIIGMGWEDLLGDSKKTAPKSEVKAESKKEDSDAEGVADYEGAYLDGEITEADYETVPSK